MVTRREIIELDETDLATVRAAARKDSTEQLVRAVRNRLNTGLEEVTALQRASQAVEPDRAHAAREALNARIELIKALPDDLVDDEQRAPALEPLHQAVKVCDQVLAELGRAPQSTPVVATAVPEAV